MAENYPHLVGNIFLHVQEAEQILRRTNSKRFTFRCFIIKPSKDRVNHKSSEREVTYYIEMILSKINSLFLIRNHGDLKAM